MNQLTINFELNPAGERIRLIDRQRLDAFLEAEKERQNPGSAEHISGPELAAWVKVQKSEFQKILQKPQLYPQTELHPQSGRIFSGEGWRIDPEGNRSVLPCRIYQALKVSGLSSASVATGRGRKTCRLRLRFQKSLEPHSRWF